ncbi:MAG: DUF2889 domain-containing protein [Thiomonas sp.]|nr:DUF2889 domain-containing protein [Thiomonas sp.]
MRDTPVESMQSSRRLVHRRSISIECYAREDGLWDLQAELRDVKTRDITLSERNRPAGIPVHDMLLVVTIDNALNIVAAHSHTLFSPYATCDDHADAYKKLVGLNLLRGFRSAVRERLGGVLGCTHLTELTQVLPTAAIQGLAGLTTIAMPAPQENAGQPQVFLTPSGSGSASRPRGHSDTERPEQMPFQLNRCHALRLDGPAVAEFYPRWAQPQVLPRAAGTMPFPQVEDETP